MAQDASHRDDGFSFQRGKDSIWSIGQDINYDKYYTRIASQARSPDDPMLLYA